VFPSSLRDLERDTDGDEEPSLRPQNPIAVATLRAADLEEFVKGNLPPPPHSLFRRGVAPVP
jgi:condensin complex subunit 1